mgnify:CR=1 FL=1
MPPGMYWSDTVIGAFWLLVLLVAVPPTIVGRSTSPAWFDGAVSATVLAVVVSRAFKRRQSGYEPHPDMKDAGRKEEPGSSVQT